MFEIRELEAALLAEGVPAVVWVTDVRLRLTAALGLERIGVDPEHVLGSSLDELLGPDGLDPRIRDAHLKALAGKGVTFETVARGCRLFCHVEPLQGSTGPTGTVGVALDASQHFESVERLESATTQLDLVLDQISGVIWTVDTDLVLTSWGGNSLQSLGVELGAGLGKHFSELFPDAPSASETSVAAHRAALEGRHARYESVVRGRTFEASVRASYDLRGRLAGAVGVAVDVTAEREAALESAEQQQHLDALLASVKEQAAQAERLEALGRLTGGIAHDFNNLLFAVRGCIGLLDEHVDAAGAEYLEVVRSTVGRCAELITQLTLAARGIDIELPTETFEIDRAFAKSRPLLGRMLPDGIELTLRLAAPGAHVCANRLQLERVLTNLVVNARDALSGTGDIVVSTRVEGSEVAAEVRDDGSGMPDPVLQRVFEPFFTTKRNGGTGFGLATCLAIVEQHGGTIAIKSAPGAGTAVTVRLPLAA